MRTVSNNMNCVIRLTRRKLLNVKNVKHINKLFVVKKQMKTVNVVYWMVNVMRFLIGVRSHLGRDSGYVSKKIDNRIVGRTQKINPDGEGSELGGFYCDLCDKTYNDDISFIQHVNSSMHQAKLGLSMNVKKSTVAAVKSRLKLHVAKRVEETTKGLEKEEEYSFKERVAQRQVEEAERLRKNKEAKQRKLERIRLEKKLVDKQNTDEETMAMMGFGSFGSTK